MLAFCCSAGVKVTDASIPRGRPHRKFHCKCCLLFWTGDYPALAATSGTHSKTCHWCTKKSKNAAEVQRRVWDGYRQYLPARHMLRGASGMYGPVETRPPPPPRTHAEYVAQGKANEVHEAKVRHPDALKNKHYKKDLPYKTTGVKECCPLRFLHLFDLVWDILPDMMHIILGIFKRHIMELFTGKRMPSTVKPRKKNSAAENKALLAANKKAQAEVAGWKLPKVHYASIIIVMLTFHIIVPA